MTIGRTPNGITTITPDDGMAVTDGITICTDIVFLGKNDSPDRWRDCEIPAEDHEEFKN